jgi:hypothetical protein
MNAGLDREEKLGDDDDERKEATILYTHCGYRQDGNNKRSIDNLALEVSIKRLKLLASVNSLLCHTMIS